MKKSTILTIVSIIIMIFVLSGCINGVPSKGEGRKVFEDSISNTAKIISFKKTNGQKAEYGGVAYYTMQYEAEIVYPEGLNTKCIKRNLMDSYYMNHCLSIGGFGGTVPTRKIGAKETKKGKIVFELTENGWVGKVERSMWDH